MSCTNDFCHHVVDTSTGSVPPEEVMEMLNELFAKFDELTRVHDVYKVETIGGTLWNVDCSCLQRVRQITRLPFDYLDRF